MPYRAKLEEALERMDRVVHAIERDSAQASPYTAQLAVQLDDSDAADSVSPALQQVPLHHARCCIVTVYCTVIVQCYSITLDAVANVHLEKIQLDMQHADWICLPGSDCARSATWLCSGGLHSQPSLAQ